MKRGAERQMTKDDEDIDGSDDVAPGQGMKKASADQIATRVIKGLPNRAKSQSTVTPAASSSFSSNSGFTFKPPAPSAPSPFLGSSSSAPSPFGTFTPSSTTASSSSKAFASILSSAAPSPFSTTSLPSATTTPATTNVPSSSKDEPPLTKYYTNLRGLNVSLVKAIEEKLKTDAFIDLTEMLESYKALRQKVQKEYDENPVAASAKADTKPSTSNGPKLSMPAPPASFAGFGGFKPAAAPAETKPAAPPAVPSSLFSGFGAKTESKPTVPPPVPPPVPSSLFGGFGSTSTAEKSTTPAPTSNPFAGFGSSTEKTPPAAAPAFTSPKKSTFSFEPSTSASTSIFGSTTPTTSPFGKLSETKTEDSTTPSPPKFAGFGAAGSSAFSFAPSTTSTAITSPTNPFSVTSSSSAPSTSIFGSTAPSSSSFQFGASANPSPFGTSSWPKPVASAESSGNAASTPKFGGSEKTEGESEAASGSATPAPEGGASESKEGTPSLLGPNPHDDEGEGEENEETLHAVKVKSYRRKMGANDWAELGVGILRIKKDKDTGVRRVLQRNSTTGKIILNFNIYPAMKPSAQAKALTFIGHSAGDSQLYCVRLGDATKTKELHEALGREIEFVKGKPDA